MVYHLLSVVDIDQEIIDNVCHILRMLQRQDVGGFLHGHNLYFWIFLFYKRSSFFHKCICLCAADDEGGYFEFWKRASEVKVTQSRQIDAGFPFGRVHQFESPIIFWARNAFDVNAQAFIA